MTKQTFATALNCMDGRTQEPVIALIKKDANVTFVDMITYPGMDGFLANAKEDALKQIFRMIDISVEKHGSQHIYIVGHFDCAGNPVSEEQHKEDIRKAVQRIKERYSDLTVKGIWVGNTWAAEIL